MTMSYAVPSKSSSGTQSATKTETESESQSEAESGTEGGSDSGDLAESFGAARRDLEEPETIDPRGFVAQIIVRSTKTYKSTLAAPEKVTTTARRVM